MSADESPDVEPGSGRWERSEQRQHWREIGISAVAAAARYAVEKTPAAAPATGETQADGAKVVTLRDAEYFAV